MSLSGRSGAAKKRARRPPPVASYAGRLVKRADMRARIQLDDGREFDKLDATVGVLLIVEAVFVDSFEVVAADVYATHPEYRFLDVKLKAPLCADAHFVEVKRTCLGEPR